MKSKCPSWRGKAPVRPRRQARRLGRFSILLRGKHQVVWRVEGLDTIKAETLLRALASQYGGDPAATDVSRLLHLPGFTNRQYNDAFVVRVYHETDTVYLQPDGSVKRMHRAETLGPVRNITRQLARSVLNQKLRIENLNQRRPQAIRPFAEFANEEWRPNATLVVKKSTMR